MKVTHVVERTSPKGEGQKFIGKCLLCGAVDLTASDALKDCTNPEGVSKDASIMMAIRGH